MSTGKVVKVGMADLNVVRAPDIVTTLGLGSCVGVTLYDPVTKLGGLVHVMLPDSTQIRNNSNEAKFADTGVRVLFNRMLQEGANRNRLIAKIAGGAHMFEFKEIDDMMRIGTRNVIAVTKVLDDLKIPLISQHTGNNYGRTIELHTLTGTLLIKTIDHGIIEI